MSQPENELRAALERMRDEAKHEEKVAKEHDDLGQHSWGFKRTAQALRRWTLVLETALASRAPATTPTLFPTPNGLASAEIITTTGSDAQAAAPATTPTPRMMSAQEHVEKCCACNHGRSPCSEYRRLRDAEDSTLAGVERTDGQARSILDGVRIEQQTDTQKVAQAAAPSPRCSHGVLMREFCQGCEDAGQGAVPCGKEPALGKVSFQLLTEKDVAEAYQAAPDWFTVLSALECRGKEPK